VTARPIVVPEVFPALTYPGPWPEDAGLLGDGTYTPLELDQGAPLSDARIIDDEGRAAPLADVLAALGGTPMEDRTLSLAVGSNGDPVRLLRKLRGDGVSPIVPMAPVRVGRLRVGHSAHVSPPGFLAAAPFGADDGERGLIALWLDDEQLAAIDLTEPNYRRLRLDGQQYPVALAASGFAYPSADVYESLRGVVHLDGAPIELMTQVALHAALRDKADGLAAFLALDDPDATIELLREAAMRDRVRAFLRDAGHARPSGLVGREIAMSRPANWSG
jgi:hypothetical protein